MMFSALCARTIQNFPSRPPRLWLLSISLVMLGLCSFVGRGFVPTRAAAFQTPAAFSCLSAASFETNLTPEGIAAGFGSNLAPSNATATSVPLPTTLNGVTVTVSGVAAGLFFVSASQINYQIPASIAAGEATVNVTRNGSLTHTGKINVVSVAPALFTANANGTGVPAAIALRLASNNAQSTETLAQLVNNRWATKAINLGPTGERVFLILFLCGIRYLPNSDGNSTNGVAENVRVLVGGLEQTPTFAAKQGGLVGVDQINVEIPRALLGTGRVKVTVLGGGRTSNEVEVEIAGSTSPTAPTVASFAPALATAGETLTVNGSGFSTTAANNVVLINGLETTAVETASATQLIVRVPYGAESGRVTVRTAQGDGSSASNVSVRTTISGLVTDTNGNPLPGVEISFGSIKTTSRNDGTYTLRDVTAGLGTLKFDPSKLPLTPAMQAVSKAVSATANRDNLQNTVPLQPVTGTATSVQTQGSAAPETVAAPISETGTANNETLALAPAVSINNGGITFNLPDNAVGVFPAGVTDSRIFLTSVANSRTPTPLPNGIFSASVAQLTPFGVKLTPGGQLLFPNSEGFAANSQVPLYKLDQTAGSATLGSFVQIGTATVSADGQRVETATNAITETSIYFAGQIRTLTTVTGRVVDSDGKTPVRRALVIVRGQESFTDGNGAFTLRNVSVPANNQLSVEASFVRPTNRVDRVVRSGISAVANSVTRITPDLVLPSATTQPNRPPTIVAPPTLALTENQTRNVPLLVSDPDANQTVQVTVSGAAFASIVQLQGVTNLRLAPGAGTKGTYTLTLRATDNLNAATTQTIAVNVSGNTPPTLSVALTQTATVGQTLAFNIAATDPDADQTLNLTASGVPSGANFTLTSVNFGRFTWTPNANQSGDFKVVFNVSDGLASDSKTVTITVKSTPTPWIITADFQGEEILAIVPAGNDLYLSRYRYGVFRSPDNGSGWTPFNQGLDLAGFHVSPLLLRNGYLIAGEYGGNKIYRTLVGSNDWKATLSSVSYTVNFVQAGGTVYAATETTGFFSSVNDGATWNKVSDFRLEYAAAGSNSLYGINDDVYRSIDNGVFWSKIGITELDTAGGVATALTVRGTEVFVGTNFSGIYYTNNNGLTWETINTGVPFTSAGSSSRVTVTGFLLHNNSVYACLNGGAAADGGGIIKFNDATRSWEPFNQGLTELRITTLAAGNGFLYAGSINGKFFRRQL